MPHDVFISYSSKDKIIADAICARLEENKIRCWIAPRDIRPGQDWATSIIDAIETCNVMVVVISDNSNSSEQVKREVERAVNKGVVIISLRIKDIILSKSLEFFLSATHWLDAITPPVENHLSKLVIYVKESLEYQKSAQDPDGTYLNKKYYKKNLNWKYIIPILTVVILIVFVSGKYTYNNYLLNTADVQYAKNDYQQAILNYNKYLTSVKNNQNAYLKLGESYYEVKNYSESLDVLKKADKIKPNNPNVLYWTGLIYEKMQDKKNAISSFKKAIVLNPKFDKAYQQLGEVYYDIKNLTEASVNLNKAVEINPSNYEAWNSLGVVYYKQGNNDQAIKSIKTSININDKNRNAYMNLASIYKRMGNIEAEQFYMNNKLKHLNKDQ